MGLPRGAATHVEVHVLARGTGRTGDMSERAAGAALRTGDGRGTGGGDREMVEGEDRDTVVGAEGLAVLLIGSAVDRARELNGGGREDSPGALAARDAALELGARHPEADGHAGFDAALRGEGHHRRGVAGAVQVRSQAPLGVVDHTDAQRVAVTARGRRHHPLVLDGGDEQHRGVVRAAGVLRQGRRGGEDGEDEGDEHDESADHENLQA